MASKNANKDKDKDAKQHRQRFTDIEANPARKLMPIDGYANEPLVSLEEAVKPLKGIVHDIESKAAWAKWKCENPPAHNLTVDQSAAVILYSMQWDPEEKCLFVVLNRTLRDENRGQLKPWFRYLKLLLTALGRLPSSTPIVYRGVKRDLKQEYQKGKTVVWWGFSSCTRTMDVLKNDLFLGAKGPRTLFTIECASGRDIEKHSAFSFEDETLLPPARQFQVVSCLPQGDDLYLVHLRETPSPVRLVELVPDSVCSSISQLQISANTKPCKYSYSRRRNESHFRYLFWIVGMTPPHPARWNAMAETVTNELYQPSSLFVDENQTVYVADCKNYRILACKAGAKAAEVVAGGRGAGDGLNQLQYPTDVIVDRETNTLLICDAGNRRVVRWRIPSPSSGAAANVDGDLVIDSIHCESLAMDDQGSLYLNDTVKNEVRRYDKGNKYRQGVVVAGGHDKGPGLNQFDYPGHCFVDADSNLYVSDKYNHRVMKWRKGAKEGVVVAGGNGMGEGLAQFTFPQGVWVDRRETIYVVDEWNNRVMRWEKGAKEGTVVVGGNGKGAAANQLARPDGLFFDRRGNLYVADWENNRVQRFALL